MKHFIKKYWLYAFFGFIAALLINQFIPSRQAVVVVKASTEKPLSKQHVKLSFADAVKKASPAVVNLFTSSYDYTKKSRPNLDLFKTLPNEPEIVTKAGSGVIVSTNGYILTNYHVIKDVDQVNITLKNGKTYLAKTIGSDPETDLAVLKINATGLTPIIFGDSEYLQIGDIVLAIGNPFGQGQSVSMGIVSATGKDKIGLNTYENFIQTDAAINPGNSGGALINQNGEVVGINSAIFSRSGGSQGIGFAIPATTAKDVLIQILEKGYVTRGWLGIEGRDLTMLGKKQLQLPQNIGIYITGVYEDGPAHQAGLQAGDVLLYINDQPIRDIQTILKITEKLTPGSVITLKGKRKNQLFIAKLKVAQRPVSN